MSLLLFGTAMLGGILGLARGASTAELRKAEYEGKLEELDRQRKLLDMQFSQEMMGHELGVRQATARTEEANKELQLLSEETLDNRDLALEQTARTGSMQSEINAMQLATLAVQNTRQVGQARQQAATSGFRGMGSALNVVEQARSTARLSTIQAKMQSRMANYQTYASALHSYTSATQQAQAYQRKIEQNRTELDRQLAAMELEMEQKRQLYELQGGYLASDIEYMNREGKRALETAMFWDVTGGLTLGAMQGVTMFM